MRSLQRATTPWIKFGKRRLDRRAQDDPLRRVRLKARGRIFRRDSKSTEDTSGIVVTLMALMAMAVGYRLAHMWNFDPGGTLLAPFVVVGIAIALWGRMPLGARILAFIAGGVFLLWPVLPWVH